MKKLTLLILCLFCYSLFSQEFEVTPTGLRDKDNLQNPYLVLDIKGKSAKELYTKSVRFIIKKYQSPDEVIKGKIEGEYLRYKTHEPRVLYLMNMGLKQYFSATYHVEMSFKDGKIKFEILQLDMRHIENGLKLPFVGPGLSWKIYNKRGKLKEPEGKKQLEAYFNGIVLNFLSNLTKDIKNDW